ncbi:MULTISPECIES: AAA family ATPase [Janthinobacterium]|uniref:AAA family ATPase n=1 Tax=Janthinobacterium TaxID=29580 RepID=UPI000873F096|nr:MULTISPECIES: AAA family ATPase [Janthinobacterium]OEZ46033.1 ATPase family associated with various cellular activities (AAA) [Janthinobacterium sp. MP5059B]PHV48101.1 AAA family ATPase [Janthinobacterium sp. BJB301]QKY07748.1 AAA domain-containing protein [Janthinobacterium lividum]
MFSKIHQAARQIGEVLVGKHLQIRQTLACVLAGGHLLIEDVPGVGKTTLAHALAISLGLQWKRQQFTSDLLPADVAGMSVYDRGSGSFIFHPGPLFTQVLLADEINRATPKTQSGLLEAMEERQVSLDGVTRALPQPFFVIATQNCAHQLGTFPLPESQLDRFLMCVTLGYPDAAAERELLLGADRRAMLQTLPAVMNAEELLQAQANLRAIHASPAVVDYVLALVHATRAPGVFADGLSPRAALALLQAARAWAALAGRDHVTPDDVQAVLIPVCAHRLHAAQGSTDSRSLLQQLLLATPV